MEFAQIWRIFVHRVKSNKISFTSALLITVFLWHTMTAENPASQNISTEDLEITEEESASKSAFLDREERFRDVEREETVKIDIRGINSKLENINKMNSNLNGNSQLYSLTNIDPDISKGEKTQAFLGQAFNVLDNFIDTNSSATYKGMKSMLTMWNPKTSKVNIYKLCMVKIVTILLPSINIIIYIYYV